MNNGHVSKLICLFKDFKAINSKNYCHIFSIQFPSRCSAFKPQNYSHRVALHGFKLLYDLPTLVFI